MGTLGMLRAEVAAVDASDGDWVSSAGVEDCCCWGVRRCCFWERASDSSDWEFFCWFSK